MTLLRFAVTMNGENLDVATDLDQPTDELTIASSSGSHGKAFFHYEFDKWVDGLFLPH